jgi:hypothetical protein
MERAITNTSSTLLFIINKFRCWFYRLWTMETIFLFFFLKINIFVTTFKLFLIYCIPSYVIVVWKCLILLLRRSQVTETHPGAAKVDFSLFISYWGGSQELISILWLVIIERKVVQWVWQHSPIKWTIEIHCWLRLICDVTHTGDGCYWITKQSFSFLSM